MLGFPAEWQAEIRFLMRWLKSQVKCDWVKSKSQKWPLFSEAILTGIAGTDTEECFINSKHSLAHPGSCCKCQWCHFFISWGLSVACWGSCLSLAATDTVRSRISFIAFGKLGLRTVGWSLTCCWTVTSTTAKAFSVGVLCQNINDNSEQTSGPGTLNPCQCL